MKIPLYRTSKEGLELLGTLNVDSRFFPGVAGGGLRVSIPADSWADALPPALREMLFPVRVYPTDVYVEICRFGYDEHESFIFLLAGEHSDYIGSLSDKRKLRFICDLERCFGVTS